MKQLYHFCKATNTNGLHNSKQNLQIEGLLRKYRNRIQECLTIGPGKASEMTFKLRYEERLAGTEDGVSVRKEGAPGQENASVIEKRLPSAG